MSYNTCHHHMRVQYELRKNYALEWTEYNKYQTKIKLSNSYSFVCSFISTPQLSNTFLYNDVSCFCLLRSTICSRLIMNLQLITLQETFRNIKWILRIHSWDGIMSAVSRKTMTFSIWIQSNIRIFSKTEHFQNYKTGRLHAGNRHYEALCIKHRKEGSVFNAINLMQEFKKYIIEAYLRIDVFSNNFAVNIYAAVSACRTRKRSLK